MQRIAGIILAAGARFRPAAPPFHAFEPGAAIGLG